MAQSKEVMQFVGRCVEKTNSKEQTLTATGKLSPPKLAKLISSLGIVPFKGKGSSVVNLWQLALAKGVCNLFEGKEWNFYNQVFDTSSTNDDRIQLKLIGSGGYANVYQFSVGKKSFALKLIGNWEEIQDGKKLSIKKKNSLESQLRETFLLKSINETCKHPALLSLIDYWVSGQRLAILTEYGGKPLASINPGWIRSHPTQILRIGQQILDGLFSLHLGGFIHRDIKPQNLLYQLTEDNQVNVKIIDFGCADRLDSPKAFKVLRGTPNYLAPYIWPPLARTEANLKSADVWSTLATLFTMLNNRISPLRKPILECTMEISNNSSDDKQTPWQMFVLSHTMEQVAEKIGLVPPPFPIAGFSCWLVSKLNLMNKLEELPVVCKELVAFYPSFRACNVKLWLEQYKAKAKQTESLSSRQEQNNDSTLTDSC